MFIMYIILLILFIVILSIMLFPIREGYMSPDINYHNGIFLVRPPYEISKLYTPYKNIMPTFQYKFNDIWHPVPE